MDPLLLAIDTAGPVAGVALLRGDQVEGSWCVRVVRGAEARLVPGVQELLRGRSLDCVALSAGPGAFTGLRVGVATALGLAVATGCRIVPVSSLRVRAAQAWAQPRVLALLDARKGRFYGGLFDARPLEPLSLGPERDLALELLVPDEPVVAVGEGAHVARAALERAGVRVAPLPDRNPAPHLARIALARLRAGATIAPEELQIRYIRPPDAKPPRDLSPARRP